MLNANGWMGWAERAFVSIRGWLCSGLLVAGSIFIHNWCEMRLHSGSHHFGTAAFLFFWEIMNSEHHYVFAHYALRRFAFAQPLRIFLILGSPKRNEFFDDVLRDVDEWVGADQQRNFSGADIQFSGYSVQDRLCAVLEMPETTNPTEAFFIAIVTRYPMEQMDTLVEEGSEMPLIQYFTLERPAFSSPECPSVFCAWERDDRHMNYGAGPEPTVGAFSEFLIERLHAQSRSKDQ